MKILIRFILVSAIGFFLVEQINAQAPTFFDSRGIGGGGALFSPSINPGNHDELYVGCDMSNLFHSGDEGQSWQMLNFKQVQGGHDSYVSFSKADTLYTVDYSSVDGIDMMRPMKSVNSGETWEVISGDPYSSAPDVLLRLLADYNNPNRVVIADYGTIYFSKDGGNTFTLIHTCIDNGAGNHIAGVFFDGDSIYIGTNDGLIYSTNGGTSFNTMSATGFGVNESMLSFAGAKENGTTRFLCLTSISVYAGIQYGTDYAGEMSGVYTMDNLNGTWAAKLSGISIGSDYPVFVGMANNDIDTMYLAGGSSAGNPIVMRSTTGGGNWQEVFLTTGNQNIYTGWCGDGGDHHWSFPEAPFGFEVCKNDSRIAMMSDYSCVHITADGGANWKQKYLSASDENPENALTPTQKKYHGIGLENTSCWQTMWVDSTHLLSAYSDINGIMSDDGGAGWKFISNLTSNSTYRIVKHSNGNIYACTSNRHDIYQTTTIYNNTLDNRTGAVYVSTNSGGSFTQIKAFNGPVIWISLDPTNADRMYAAVINSDTTKGGIWKTNNLSAGVSAVWTKCKNAPRTEGHPFNINVLSNGALVVTYSAHKPTSGSSFTQSSGVFYSTDGVQTWADRSDNNMKFYTQDVIVDVNDTSNSTWYACVFSAWGSGVPSGTGGVYKTTNKGVSWTQISDEYRANSCTINPSNSNEMYVTTETDGLLYSNNINSVSPTFTPVAAYPFRHPMRVFFNPWNLSEIWVTAFGYGMAVANINCSITIPSITQNGDTLTSSAATTYQWLLNGNPISGANSQSYIPTESGNYSVQTHDGGICSATAQSVSVTISGIKNVNGVASIEIFPNPTNNNLNVLLRNVIPGIHTINIYNAIGQKIFEIATGDNTLNLNVDELSSGLYFIKANGMIRKLVKQ